MKGYLDLTLHFVLSDSPPGWMGRSGDLTQEVLKSCLEECPTAAHYFVCGPPAMMDSVAGALKDLGVPRDHIISERFDLGEGKGLTQSLRARVLHIGLAAAFAGAALIFAATARTPIGPGGGHGFLIDKHMEAGLICKSCHSAASLSAAPDMAACAGCHGGYSRPETVRECLIHAILIDLATAFPNLEVVRRLGVRLKVQSTPFEGFLVLAQAGECDCVVLAVRRSARALPTRQPFLHFWNSCLLADNTTAGTAPSQRGVF